MHPIDALPQPPRRRAPAADGSPRTTLVRTGWLPVVATLALAGCQDAPLAPSDGAASPTPTFDLSPSASGLPLSWYISRDGGFDVVQLGREGDVPVPADYDGDGRTDPAIFNSATATWTIARSGWQDRYDATFGSPGDIPVPGDYDGDGLSDLAVFRPGTGQWWIFRSETGTTSVGAFGTNTDIPVPGDYDGDGMTDIAIFRPGSAQWWIQKSSGGVDIIGFGLASDILVPADYDGDGRTDIAVYRPAGGQWYIRDAATGGFELRTWGSSTDVPVPGDYDGDGQADAAIFRPSTGQWWILQTTTGTQAVVPFGLGTDQPAPGRYAGGAIDRLATIRAAQLEQQIVFTSEVPDVATVGATYALSATGGGSGNPIEFTSLTPATCSVSASTATFLALGTCTIAANQQGNADYAAAEQVTQTVMVVLPFAFAGSTQPLPALNSTPSGGVAKVVFDLGGNLGLNVLASGSPRSGEVSCASPTLPPSSTAPTKASGPGLSFAANAGVYTYAWKTEKAWRGSCRAFVVELIDGSTHTAVYLFR